MTVKELMEILSKVDPNLMVVVSGYEGGVTEPGEVKIKTAALNVNKEWYYGEHEIVENKDEYPEKTHAEVAYIS